MKFFNICILMTALLLLSYCKKEAVVQPKEYPYVITYSPKVSSDGAEFLADLISLGNQTILKYGFVWSSESNPTIQDFSILFNDNPGKGIYSCHINTGLTRAQTYYVRAYILTDQYEVYGKEKSFRSQGSLSPIINDFSPKYGAAGTKVVIDGENFGVSENSNVVRFGKIEVSVDSASANQLVVTIPEITKPEKVRVFVETAGMVATSQDSFDLWFIWKRLNDFAEGYIDGLPVSFTLNGRAYFGLGFNKVGFWEYDPTEDRFIRKADFPKHIGAYSYPFTAAGKAYIIFSNGNRAFNSPSELWEYSPLDDSWTRKTDFPGNKRSGAVTFSINDKGYITTGKYWDSSGWDHSLRDTWEYDPSDDSWTQKADLPGPFRTSAFSCSFGNFGYVGLGYTDVYGQGQKNIYKYDPQSDSWTFLTEYPGEGYVGVKGIMINGKCYLGLGSNLIGSCYSDFWEFDIESISWKKLYSCPISMRANLSFTLNNKGYIGIGWHDYYDYSKRLYEFDPEKD